LTSADDVSAILRPNYPNAVTLPLRAGVVHVGRAVFGPADIQVAFDDARASRLHAILYERNGDWHIEDVSRNGTLVNNRPLTNDTLALRSGDTIRIGTTFNVTFFSLAETAGDATGGLGATQDAARAQLAARAQPSSKVGIWMNPTGQVMRDEEALPATLSPTEQKLLDYLLARPGTVCDYPALSKAVWGDVRTSSAMHELIYRLRRKIEVDPAHPRYLIIRPKSGVVLYPKGEPV
jgi:hypothetical protein